VAEIPFCCRNGHIPLSRKPPCPGGQVGEGVSPALDASCILNGIICSSNRTGRQLSSICEVEASTWDNAETP
jgi:hypothetical protein